MYLCSTISACWIVDDNIPIFNEPQDLDCSLFDRAINLPDWVSEYSGLFELGKHTRRFPPRPRLARRIWRREKSPSGSNSAGGSSGGLSTVRGLERFEHVDRNLWHAESSAVSCCVIARCTDIHRGRDTASVITEGYSASPNWKGLYSRC